MDCPGNCAGTSEDLLKALGESVLPFQVLGKVFGLNSFHVAVTVVGDILVVVVVVGVAIVVVVGIIVASFERPTSGLT